jgi:hypothetical protein
MKLLAFLCLLCACSRAEKRVVDDKPTAVAVDAEHALIKTGMVGTENKADGTYVLVDVKNNSGEDRLIGVVGKLLDGDGKEVGALHWDEMRVPAGAIRTFALVSKDPVAGAVGATYRVVRAEAVAHPAEIVIEEATTPRQDGALVAAGWLRNREQRGGSAVAAATFYGADGKILARPFTIVRIPPGARRPVRFVGSKEATEAALFVGEVVFE